MDFDRPTLTELQERVSNDYLTRFQLLKKTPRYNLLSAISKTDAGMYHGLYSNLVYLSRQIFPDTAEGEMLRAHWSDRVPPLSATGAIGPVQFSGTPSAPVPAGLLLKHANGQEYYLPSAVKIAAGGTISGTIKASVSGAAANLEAGETLSIISSVPPGVNNIVTVVSPGLTGGIDSESDEDYLARVLLYLRSSSRYGKKGDFAAWAIDSSPEVSNAWEFKNYSIFGALLIQVVQGSHLTGLSQVTNLELVKSYIETVAPPALFTVKTPEILFINPTVTLLPTEDTLANRELAENRMKTYLSIKIEPGITVTAAQIRDSIVDGLILTDATVVIERGSSTKLQILDTGVITWG